MTSLTTSVINERDALNTTQLLQEFANRTVNYDIIEKYSVSNSQAAALF